MPHWYRTGFTPLSERFKHIRVAFPLDLAVVISDNLSSLLNIISSKARIQADRDTDSKTQEVLLPCALLGH